MIDQAGLLYLEIPDDGMWYADGETVRVHRVVGGVHVVPDPYGDYEVRGCRHASDCPGDRGMLSVQLASREA